MSLLPTSSSDADSSQEGAIRVENIVGEDADAVFDALSATTSRELLRAVHEDPGTPSDLAGRLDTTVQNVGYHLEKLHGANLVRVADTEYSSRGQEMDVYAPSENPTVLFVGSEERKRSLLGFLKEAVGALAVLGIISVAVHTSLLGTVPYIVRQASGGTDHPPFVLAAFAGGVLFALVLLLWSTLRSSTRTRDLITGVQRETRGPSVSGMDLVSPVVAASVAFTVSFAFWFLRDALGLVFTLDFYESLSYLAVIAVLVSATAASLKARLTSCWTLAGAGFAGLVGHEVSTVLSGYLSTDLLTWLAYIVMAAVGSGITLGTIGFAIGHVGLKVRDWVSGGP